MGLIPMCNQKDQVNSIHKENLKESKIFLDWPEPDAAFSHQTEMLHILNHKVHKRQK